MINRLFLILILSYWIIPLSAFQLEIVNGEGSFGVIDSRSNELLLSKTFQSVGWPQGQLVENTLIRAQKNERWALYKTNGEAITAHEFVSVKPFLSDYFIASKISDNSVLQQFGLIDRRGKQIIPFNYLRIAAAGDRLIATTKNASGLKQTLFNEKGKALIQGEFAKIEPLNDQYFAVGQLSKRYALFDSNGMQQSPFEFQRISSLKNRVFLISYYNRLGVINGTGDLIVPPMHRRIFLGDEEIKTESYPEWTLYNQSGMATFYFDDVQALGDSLLIFESGNDLGIINRKEEYLGYIIDHEVIQLSRTLGVIRDHTTGRYGLINEKGQKVLSSNYDSLIALDHFALAKIQSSTKVNWTAIDDKGQAINTDGYRSVKAITPNQQVILEKKSGLGLLSAYGKELTSFNFQSMEMNQLAQLIVKTDRGLGLLNEDGDWLITPYKDSLTLSDDHYKFRQGSAYGIADIKGQQLALRYEPISFLPGGYMTKSKDGFQIYSLQDSLLFDYSYDTAYALNDKLWYLQRGTRSFIYRHEDGNIAPINGFVEQMGRLKENYISFKQDGQWGYLDELAQLRIANRYDSVTEFSEGLSAVKLIGKWGAINRSEEIIVQPVYDSISSFYNALAIVKAGGKLGLVDRIGQSVLDIKYDQISRFDDWIRIKIGNLVGISDIRGRIIKSPQYNEVKALENGYFLVRKDFSYGITDQNGNDLIPVVYDHIEPTPIGFLASKKGKINSYPLR